MDFYLAPPIIDRIPTVFFLVPVAWAVVYFRFKDSGDAPRRLTWLLPTLVALCGLYHIAGNARAFVLHSRNPVAEALFYQYCAAQAIVSNALFAALEAYGSWLLCRFLRGAGGGRPGGAEGQEETRER